MASNLELSANNNSSEGDAKHDSWIPLESNPEVFNSWASQAGLITNHDQFVDIYGLDDDLLSIIPKPTKAVVLLFPDNAGINTKHAEQDEKITKDGQYPIDETLFFVKQNIKNACGTIALIHAIANSEVTYFPNSPLQQFITECKDKSPEERAEFLKSTDLFTKIHLDSSLLGQTPQPTSDEEETDLHFSCFVAAPDGGVRKAAQERQQSLLNPVGMGEGSGAGDGAENITATSTSDVEPTPTPPTPPPLQTSRRTLIASREPPPEGALKDMRLIELDGRRPFPVDHGPCTDVLEDAIEVIKKQYLSQVESVYFSLMALGAAPPANSPFN